jgi:putative transposase
VILDIYSRYAVGWMVAYREAALLAERLLADTIAAQGVKPAQLTIHADRGTSMTSKPVAMLLAFPERFGCIQDARAFCRRFFGWYNCEHRNSGIALLTPADVHLGRAEQITLARGAVLDAAFAAHPERFVGKPPQPPRLPEAVWINKPIDPSEPPQQFPA